MSTARPKTIIFIAIALVILALISTTLALTNRLNVGRVRQPGTFTGNSANGGNLNNGGNTQGGATDNGGNFQGNTPNGGGNFQGRGGNNNVFSIFRNLGINFQVIGYVTTGFTVLGILLALLCAYGVWQQKKWGLNWGMVIAVLFLIGALPTLFALGGRNLNLLRTSLNLLSLVGSVCILVLGVLPSVRDSVK